MKVPMSDLPEGSEAILLALASRAKTKLSTFEAENARHSTTTPENIAKVNLAYHVADEARIALMAALHAAHGGRGHYDEYEDQATQLIEQAEDGTLRHLVGIPDYGWSWRQGGWALQMGSSGGEAE
ncbi:hypothetical protein SAMN05421811_127112 [Nonomuraea wenchangensis]|uniref:Uncharacterized protein n=2 Tax=Nonomuraea wenchangensis TaxID=568860 RepID=A0A1I0LWI3_9ACTN|nr:hypothetical protein SAMN05421811_127112 [Nonomuraea wenchangensis]